MSEILTAQVKRAKPDKVWLYRNDSGWTILKTDQGICKGVIEFEPKEGDPLELAGTWTRSDRNGELEFNFKSATINIPVDPRALLHYAATLTKGMGLSMESDVWATYGAEWKKYPELDGIPRVNKSIIFAWGETLKRLENDAYRTQTMAYLLEHGCTDNLALLAWNHWADKTLGKVQANCFCLAELPNYGFAQIDNMVRDHFDIGNEDPRRLDACVLYYMKQAISTGNTLIEWYEIRNPVVEYIPSAAGRFKASVDRLVETDTLLRIEDPLGLKAYLALPRNYADELQIWEWSKEIGEENQA